MADPRAGVPNEYYDPEDPFGNNKSYADNIAAGGVGYETYETDPDVRGYTQVSNLPEVVGTGVPPEYGHSGMTKGEVIYGQPPPGSPEAQAEDMFGLDPIQLKYGTDITPYAMGDPNLLSPERVAAADPGASAFEGVTSKYGDLGPSEFEDLALDPTARADIVRAQKYFGDLMAGGGRDAVSEAEFARRSEQAEQRRRAATEAAQREAEARGMPGQGVLAAFSNAQGSANDLHEAGLTAAAIAQQRRDQAAEAFGGTSERLADAELKADAARAQGVDSFGIAKAGGEDSFGLGKAQGQDNMATFKAAEANKVNEANATRDWDRDTKWFDRTTNTGDKNTDLKNATTTFNKVSSPQQLFENQLKVTQGITGQYNQGSNQWNQNAQEEDKQSEGVFGKLGSLFGGFF